MNDEALLNVQKYFLITDYHEKIYLSHYSSTESSGI